MNVLLLTDYEKQTDGGSTTLQASILKALVSHQSSHTILIANPSKISAAIFPEIAAQNSIDFVWALGPYFVSSLVPYAITVWDLAHRIYPMFPEVSTTGWTFDAREALYQTALTRASKIITGTQAGKKQIQNLYRAHSENIEVIPFPVRNWDEIVGNSEEISADNSPYLFYPAQFWPHKNHTVLVEALRLLVQMGRSYRLILSGADKGNLEHIKQQANQLNVASLISYVGFVSETQLKQLYSNAFALVYPSFFGPDNLPPLEAMALGCPVICADIEGARDQLGAAADYFNPLNPHELAARLIQLETPEKRKQRIKAGKALCSIRTADHYAAEIIVQLDIYEQISKRWNRNYKHS